MDNHPHIINASIQLIPVQAGNRHPYAWVDEVIELIQASGITYEVGPFSTSLEADYKSVMQLIDKINTHLLSKNCPEWLLQVQIQVRSGASITSAEKTHLYRL